MPTHAPRTILVTGSTDGIGLQTALTLAQRGHTVLLHGRSPERLAAAAARVRALPGVDPSRVDALAGDLSSLAQVRQLAAKVADRYPALDTLLNNAGVYLRERAVTEDGFEATFAINHLAPFLLTHLLLPAIAAAEDGRILNVSSIAHTRGQIDWEGLRPAHAPPQRYDAYAAYAASKLANILFTRALAARLGARPTVNALHPGVVSTKLLVQGFGVQGQDSLEKAAATSVFLAEAPVRVTGRYFVHSQEAPVAAVARDEAAAERLYTESCASVGITGVSRRDR